ncbi:PD-(D/E)XK nuclease superfamily protein [Aquimixticola soesokkakensis]|uniref:PD-(D/E)XK nuclease superfamily protein n=1 Tax=Aquimixticola soesokkakensis TaxID=1519096 RepID=A0A1Y5RCX8_9RHOB|nr:double-strand break repair protein AddB [Aquimixticola soesokkakensis]SLN12033.1 PD-(D/E)XK nuclease superfamily protein [Aquimixticola soesokkakensis]
MFSASDTPRVFGLTAGADFPSQLAQGVLARTADLAPEALARVEIYVNTTRMERRLKECFSQNGARLLPRIRLVTQLARDLPFRHIEPAVSSLRRRLELSQLVTALLDREPDLAARASIFDLANSLAGLLAEMHDEGIAPSVLQTLDVPDQSGHWDRARKFLQIVEQFFGDDSAQPPMAEARFRRVVETLVELWQSTPPQHPIIIAGSTGSRGATALLMQAVARLPQGAVVLPGFDPHLPRAVWDRMAADETHDHPQYRFVTLCRALTIAPTQIALWQDSETQPARNALVSLALRPAPVTDQWMIEGPKFSGLDAATQGLTLLKAPSPRIEALSIACVLRDALERGKTSALITPDRTLARRVTAALHRWNIEPDDSGGVPLGQTAPGRLFRQISTLFGRKLTAEDLLSLLKHPLVAGVTRAAEREAELQGPKQEGRGYHMLWVRQLEGALRRNGPAFPDRTALVHWAAQREVDDGRMAWVRWISDVIEGFEPVTDRSLSAHLDHLLAASRSLVGGADGHDDRELWSKKAGHEARKVITELTREAPYGGTLSPSDFSAMIRALLARAEARDPNEPHPKVRILGTLEARVGGCDLVVLGGLNDGTWPSLPPPDPWLSRQMRTACGLVSPEQRVGLAAHDFQQAMGSNEVVLSRAIRNAEAETVASRWVNRLTNLMEGMSQAGRETLVEIEEKGRVWVEMAERLEKPDASVPRATRPSPRPPLAARPRQLSVTKVERLIRDPYAIYAERVLKLEPLNALAKDPDPRLRGIVIHRIVEEYVEVHRDEPLAQARARLLGIAQKVLEEDVPWPSAQRIWLARIARIADYFIATENARRARGTPVAIEDKGEMHLPEIDFSLRGKADRIDRAEDGSYLIYDYKASSPPSKSQLKKFNVQLHLEAMMVEDGHFEKLPAGRVTHAQYLGLGSIPKTTEIVFDRDHVHTTRHELIALISAYDALDKGYTARRAMEQMGYDFGYDHLARFGEWEDSDDAVPEDLP